LKTEKTSSEKDTVKRSCGAEYDSDRVDNEGQCEQSSELLRV